MSSPIRDLPPATSHWEEIAETLGTRTPAVFLDFDGTLSPIVEDPAAARLDERMRGAVERLRARCPVTVMSGRDAEDVGDRVRVDGVVYAGSHGFDVIWPDGRREQRGLEYTDSLRAARERLEQELASVPMAEVEAKRFAIAIHYRRVARDRVDDVETAVARVADRFDDLRRTGGKQVFELRPDLDWDKGRALLWLLEDQGLDHDRVVPIYVGDDLTDEDAFEALLEHGTGLTLVVQGEDDERRSLAQFSLADVPAAGAFLARLADHLEQRG